MIGEDAPARRPRSRRWPRRAAGVGLAAAVLAAVLASGWPQERAIELVAAQVLGARVELQGLRLWRGGLDAMRISGLQGPVQAVTVQDVAWTFRRRGETGPLLHGLRVAKVEMIVDLPSAQDQGRAAWQGDARGETAAFARWGFLIPRRIALEHVEILEAQADRPGLLLPLTLEGEFHAFDDFSIVAGTPATATLQGGANPAADAAGFAGVFQLSFQARRGAYAADFSADLPGQATISGKLAYGVPTPEAFQVEVDKVSILDARLPGLIAAYLGLPLRFGKAHSEGLHAQGTLAQGLPRFARLRGAVVLDDLSLGDPALPWLARTITVRAAMEAEAAERIAFSLQPEALPEIEGTLALVEAGWQLEASSEAWTPAQWQGLSPAFGAYPARLAALRAVAPRLSGRADGNGLAIDLVLTPQFSAGAKPLETPVRLTLAQTEPGRYACKVTWPTPKAGTLSLETGMAEGVVQDLRWTLDGARLAPWYALLYDAPVPGGWDASGTLAGGLALASGGFGPFTAEGSVQIIPAIQGAALPGRFSLRVEQTNAEEAGPVTFSVDLGEAGRLDAKEGRLLFSGGGGYRLPLQWRGELDTWAAVVGLGGVSGEGEISTTLVDTPGEYQCTDLRLSLDTPGYAAYRLPYGAKMLGKGALNWRKSDGLLSLRKVEITVDDASRLAFDLGSYDPVGGVLNVTALEGRIDLGLAARKGWLAAARNALLTLRAERFGHAPAGFTGGIAIGLEAEAIALPGSVATATGISGALQADTGNGALSGTGRIAMEHLRAAGVTLPRLASPLRIEGSSLRLESLATVLFGGAVSGSALVAIAGGVPALTLDAQVQDLDLAVFTEEFKPPRVQLAGKASGSVRGTVSQAGLQALDVDLSAPGGVSVNRAVVEELVRAQGLAGMQEQVADKVLRRFLGDAPMRPFDRGELKLGMAEGRLTGFARLVSKDLKLSADIKADPGAILEAFQNRAD